MSNYIQSNQVVTLPVGGAGGAFSISSNDSGKLLLLPTQNVAQTITLPQAQAGLRYRIMANTGAGTVGVNTTVQGPLNAALAVPAIFIGSMINFTVAVP